MLLCFVNEFMNNSTLLWSSGILSAWTPCQTDAGSTHGATFLFFITTHVVVTQSLFLCFALLVGRRGVDRLHRR